MMRLQKFLTECLSFRAVKIEEDRKRQVFSKLSYDSASYAPAPNMQGISKR